MMLSKPLTWNYVFSFFTHLPFTLLQRTTSLTHFARHVSGSSTASFPNPLTSFLEPSPPRILTSRSKLAPFPMATLTFLWFELSCGGQILWRQPGCTSKVGGGGASTSRGRATIVQQPSYIHCSRPSLQRNLVPSSPYYTFIVLTIWSYLDNSTHYSSICLHPL